jgi:hypothetical protein
MIDFVGNNGSGRLLSTLNSRLAVEPLYHRARPAGCRAALREEKS